jgi:hypothetical protein
MKRFVLIAVLLCAILALSSCGKTESLCDQAQAKLNDALALKEQAEEELNNAKKGETILGIPGIRDSEETKQARAKLAAANLAVDEKTLQKDAACKQK